MVALQEVAWKISARHMLEVVPILVHPITVGVTRLSGFTNGGCLGASESLGWGKWSRDSSSCCARTHGVKLLHATAFVRIISSNVNLFLVHMSH